MQPQKSCLLDDDDDDDADGDSDRTSSGNTRGAANKRIAEWAEECWERIRTSSLR